MSDEEREMQAKKIRRITMFGVYFVIWSVIIIILMLGHRATGVANSNVELCKSNGGVIYMHFNGKSWEKECLIGDRMYDWNGQEWSNQL